MKWGVRGVADSDDSAGVKSSVGQKVVVRWRGVLGGAEGRMLIIVRWKMRPEHSSMTS